MYMQFSRSLSVVHAGSFNKRNFEQRRPVRVDAMRNRLNVSGNVITYTLALICLNSSLLNSNFFPGTQINFHLRHDSTVVMNGDNLLLSMCVALFQWLRLSRQN